MTKFTRTMTPAEFIAAVQAEAAEIEAEQVLLDAHKKRLADDLDSDEEPTC